MRTIRRHRGTRGLEVVIIEEPDRDIESILRSEMVASLHGHDDRLHAWYAPSLIFRRGAAA